MQKVYLSRRNLQTLLNKLDRNVNAQNKESECTIIKMDTVHPVYPCTDVIEVVALEDHEYYTNRVPGSVHEADTPKVEYRVQVQSLKTQKWRDSINEDVNNPYDSFYAATAAAMQQQERGNGLQYKVAVVPIPKKYQVEYLGWDGKWQRSINHYGPNHYNTREEAEADLKLSEKANMTGLQYRIVEVNS